VTTLFSTSHFFLFHQKNRRIQIPLHFLSVCHTCNTNDVAGFWSLMFGYSKVIELGDTLFIVLRKRPLVFLHYYHHAAVLIYTSHTGFR
jgi:hypothetical protein